MISDAISNLAGISKILEVQFFYTESLVLKNELARLQREKENEEALSKASGIVNESVLHELVAFGIRPETMAALCLVPIIEVAWANGIIEVEERKAVLKGAKKFGFIEDQEILQEWLLRRPDPSLMDAWKVYMQRLSEVLSKETLATLQTETLKHAELVAKAAGNFLGLTNPISPEELAVLDTIASTFRQQNR
jgi:hypothetical protein